MSKEKDNKKVPFKAFSKKGLAAFALAGVMLSTPFALIGCGKAGPKGDTGATGAAGEAGTPGSNGKSAYELAVENGFTGTVQEWLDSLKGSNGTNTYVRYANVLPTSDADMLPEGTAGDYIGIYVGATAPTSYSSYTWHKIKGEDGEGQKGDPGDDGSKWYSGEGAPTSQGKVGDVYLNLLNHDIYEKKDSGWVLIGNIDDSSEEEVEASKQIGDHYMISDGLTEMAANAVELTVDEKTGIAYACYLSSETSLGEATQLVKIAKFNIMQPTNIEWIEVFNKSTDFGGNPLLECNIIDVSSSKVRVFAVNKSTWKYYYKDVDKTTNQVSELKEVKFKTSESATPVEFSKTTVNQYISSIGGTAFGELQITTKILELDGCFYTTAVGGGGTRNVLFLKSTNGDTWTVQSVIYNTANYEAMLEYHDNKFWVMCRNGVTNPTSETQQNLLYSEDGITWTKSNLALTMSDTRPYLFKYQGDLFLAYSSPMETDYSTIRNWRCNIHVGRIVSGQEGETFEEVVYKESKFGIVYYALTEWYGNMIMLYSSGEMHPTEGLMGPWSQGKDCLNYTILHQEEPELAFKKLDSISIVSLPNTTNYNVGDTFSATGLAIRVKYNNGSYNTITSGFEVSTPDMSTVGTKTITVTYTEGGVEKTATFDINVTEVVKEEESITIKSLPTKKRYVVGETFSAEGLVVEVNYNVGTPRTLSNTEYSLSTVDMSTTGTKTITITYLVDDTMTATFTIEVVEENSSYVALPSITSNGTQYIDITGYKTKPNTKVVIDIAKPQDELINAAGRWLFSSSSSGDTNARLFGVSLKREGGSVLDYGGNRVDTGVINWQDGVNTIAYGNGVFEINGDNLLKTGSLAAFTTTPTQSIADLRIFSSTTTSATDYLPATIYGIKIYEGDTLVMNLVPAQNPNPNQGRNGIGLYDTISENWYYSATSSDVVEGDPIEAKTLSSIAIQSNPNITQYAVGDTFVSEGLIVKAIYDNDTYRLVSNYTLSTPEMSTAGTKTITVTYTEGGVEKTTTFDITVTAEEKALEAIEIVSMPSRVTYNIGDTFSTAGLVVRANYTIGASKTLSSGEYQISTPDMSTVGTKTITVTYTEDGVEKTTTFEISVIEKEYKELAYVTGTGTQYIDTGIVTKANTKIVISMDKPTDFSGNTWLFNSGMGKYLGFNVKDNGGFTLDYANKRYGTTGASGVINTGTITWAEGKNTLTFGNGEFTINGSVLATGLENIADRQSTANGTLTIFTSHTTDATNYCPAKIYSIAIYEGDTLVMNLVPAQEPDGGQHVGFYDTVSGEWILSATGVDFEAGPAL